MDTVEEIKLIGSTEIVFSSPSLRVTVLSGLLQQILFLYGHVPQPYIDLYEIISEIENNSQKHLFFNLINYWLRVSDFFQFFEEICLEEDPCQIDVVFGSSPETAVACVRFVLPRLPKAQANSQDSKYLRQYLYEFINYGSYSRLDASTGILLYPYFSQPPTRLQYLISVDALKLPSDCRTLRVSFGDDLGGCEESGEWFVYHLPIALIPFNCAWFNPHI